MLLVPDIENPTDRRKGENRFGYLVPQLFGLADLHLSAVSLVRAIRDLEGSRLIPADWLPQMVTFDDENVPASVRHVDPQHLENAFGPGVHFVEASVGITKDPVTTGIEKFIPWVRSETDAFLEPRSFNQRGLTFPQKLTISSFRGKND